MPNRTKTAASPIFAAFLASVFSTAVACGAARAADDCLNEPKHQTPRGGHWYYRIDGPDHRKCWFLADEGQKKVSQAVSEQRMSSPLPLPRRTAAAIRPPLADAYAEADAHAELPMVTTPTEPPQWLGPTGMSNPEPITEGVPDTSPEMGSPPSARDPEDETKVMSNGVTDAQSRTEMRTELLPVATAGVPAAELSAEAEDQLRVRLGLRLIALGLFIIAGCLILSTAVRVGRRIAFSNR